MLQGSVLVLEMLLLYVKYMVIRFNGYIGLITDDAKVRKSGGK